MNPVAQDSIPTAQNLAPISVLKRKRRPHGKIAELPKPLRDQINQMLDDGLSYRKIAEKLKTLGSDLPKGTISRMSVLRWHENGYRRHLDQQQRLAEVRANREASLDMVNDGDTTILPEADLQLIASQYYDIFAHNQAHIIKQTLAEEPLHYPRFLNAFARLTREILKLKNYRDLCAKEKAAQLPQLDPDRDLNDNECAAWARRMDKLFFGRRRRPTEAGVRETKTHPHHELTHCPSAHHNLRPERGAKQDHHRPAALPLPKGEGRGEGEQDSRTP